MANEIREAQTTTITKKWLGLIITLRLAMVGIAVEHCSTQDEELNCKLGEVQIPEILGTKELKPKGNIKDIVVLNNGNVVAIIGNVAYMYDRNLELIKQIGATCENVALTKDGELVFTDDTNVLRFYSTDGSFRRNLYVPNLKVLKAVRVNSKNEIVVVGWRTHILYHIDINTGEIISKTTPRFEQPFSIAINSKDVVIVSDHEAEEIIAVTRDDEVVFRYGTSGRGHGQLLKQWGVCTDKADHIIVADSENFRVHILTPDGTFIRYLMTAELDLKFPWSVAINNEGHLLVGDLDGNIHTIKYRE